MCSNSKSFTIDMMNRGLDELTSIKMMMEIDNGDTFEYEWNGSIESYQIGKITFDMDVPIGTHDIDFRIVEANGKPLDFLKTITTTCGWDWELHKRERGNRVPVCGSTRRSALPDWR